MTSITLLIAQLIAAREAAGMTQRDLANATGIGQTQIAHWEAGRWKPNLVNLVRWCDFLDLDVVLAPRAEQPALSALVEERFGRGRGAS